MNKLIRRWFGRYGQIVVAGENIRYVIDALLKCGIEAKEVVNCEWEDAPNLYMVCFSALKQEMLYIMRELDVIIVPDNDDIPSDINEQFYMTKYY